MFKNTKGFITVEAAIFLPIFIIGILTFAYLIKFMSIQENMFHSFADEARVLSSEAVINPAAPINFESKLKSRLLQENGDNILQLDLDHFEYLYANGKQGMISMDLNYDVIIKLPSPFYKEMPVSESLIVRGFVGKEINNDPMPFEEMEKEKESTLVWVFPRAGGKYHKENCTYISSEPIQMIMSNSLRKKYKSCSICNSYELKNGNKVYCFIKTGEAYHTGSCPTVDKYVISMEKEDAIRKGYTPCSKCGEN
ncbi:MAG: hypothetical protein AAGU75_01700 [Bacillota bacterium]